MCLLNHNGMLACFEIENTLLINPDLLRKLRVVS